MKSLPDMVSQLGGMRSGALRRDAEMRDTLAVREGRWQEVSWAKDMLPEEWPKPVVANQIASISMDKAGQIAPLPAVECISEKMDTDKGRKFADKRSKIARNYVEQSNLQAQMEAACDRWLSYGFMAYVVEPDFDRKQPRIVMDNQFGVYYTLDRVKRRTRTYAQVYHTTLEELCMDFPEHAAQLMATYRPVEGRQIECCRWMDDDQIAIFTCSSGQHILLSQMATPTGKCLARVVELPGASKTPRGAFVDVIGPQMAKAKAGVYLLKTMDETANAPWALPLDVQDLDLGPDGIVRSETPEKVARIPLNVPSGLFAESQSLDREIIIGSRYTQGRTGAMDANIITGQGVDALNGIMSTEIAAMQLLNAQALEDTLSMCLELDQKMWGNRTKSVRGQDDGAPYAITYKPSVDIAGDYTVQANYGMLAGLDPNRALVFVLQMRTGGMLSLDASMRLMSRIMGGMDVERERTAIELETFEQSVLQAVASYAQAIPMMASQGADPSQAVSQIAAVYKRRMKGESVVDAVEAVFAPKAPPQQPGAPEAAPPGAPAQPGQPQPGAPGQPPSPAQSLLQSVAGISPSGRPQMGTTLKTRQPVPTG